MINFFVYGSRTHYLKFFFLSALIVSFSILVSACTPSSLGFTPTVKETTKDVFSDEYLSPRIVKCDVIDRSCYSDGLDRGSLITGRAGQSLLLAHGLSVGEEGDNANPLALTASSSIASDYIEPEPQETVNVKVKSGVTGQILTTAYGQTGRSYKSGGSSPSSGFDASGFTRWVYGQKGVSLSRDIKRQANGGKAVAREDLRPGDLLVYRNSNSAYHVGIYTGNGNIIHAAPKSGVVTETAAFGPQLASHFVGGRRYYDDPGAAPLSDNQKMAATSMAVKTALADLSPGEKRIQNKTKYSSKKAAASSKKTGKKSAGKSRKR